jgi:hypothetical protein
MSEKICVRLVGSDFDGPALRTAEFVGQVAFCLHLVCGAIWRSRLTLYLMGKLILGLGDAGYPHICLTRPAY